MRKLLIAIALAGALTAPALAQQDARVHVRGKIVSLDGNVLTVGAVIGDRHHQGDARAELHACSTSSRRS